MWSVSDEGRALSRSSWRKSDDPIGRQPVEFVPTIRLDGESVRATMWWLWLGVYVGLIVLTLAFGAVLAKRRGRW